MTAGLSPMSDQPRPFIGIDGNAFEVVVRELPVQLCRIEIAHRQTHLTARDCHACCRVCMHHAMCSRDARVYRSVHSEAGRVDWPVGVADDIAGEVDFDQIGGAHLTVVQAERIDQKVRSSPGSRSVMWL